MQKNGLEYREYIPNKHNWTTTIMNSKLNHITDVICDMDAQIVALQEIENSNVLNLLTEKLKEVGCAYNHSAITKNKNSTIQVALISRYPISETRELSIGVNKRDRPILEATVMIEGYPLTLFINHWKAKSRYGVESRRVAYAIRLAKSLLPNEYIILGDLNSNYNEYQRMNKKLDDTNGTTGINHLLKTIDRDEIITKNQIVTKAMGFHYNLWLELLSSKRWSYKFYANRLSLDHILLPPQLFDGKGIDYVNNSFKVFRPSYLFTKKGWINSWRYKNKHIGVGYSDHLPIYALFDIKPYIKTKPKKITISSIDQLYSNKSIKDFKLLKNCVVVLRRGKSAIIKQTNQGRAIYLYNISNKLEEGSIYDITIDEIASYSGLKEIIGVIKSKKIGSTELSQYYLNQKDLNYKNLLLQNQVFINLSGVYRKGKFYINDKQIPIYFKRKKLIPKDGTQIKILYAHLGYYNKPQLVIYDQKDFILEN